MDNNTNMKKNVAWNTLGSVFYCACQWLITVLVVRISGYGTAGYLSLAMTTSSSFSAISLFSMRNYQVSDVTDEYTASQYVGSRLFTSMIALAGCSVVAILTSSWYQALCIIAFMLIRVAEALVDVLHGINQKYDRYDLIGKSYILRGIATIISFIVMLKVVNNLFVTLMIIAILNLIIAILFDWRNTDRLEKIQPEILSKAVLELLKKCAPIVIFSFLLSLENLIPKNVLQELAGTDEVGIYSSIASPTLVVQVFASVAFNPFLPKFSTLYVQKKYDAFLKLLHKAYVALAVMGLVVTAGGMLLGRIGLKILFGADILQYYDLFMPIVWCTILTAIIWILSSLVIALRQIKWLLIGMIVDFGMCIAVVYPCVNYFGKNGVSFVQIMAYAIYILYMIAVCEITLL